MKFLKINDKQLEKILANLYKKELEELLDFTEEFITSDILSPIPPFIKNKALRYKAKKHIYEALFFSLFTRDSFRQKFYKKLILNELSTYLYNLLVWEEKEVVGAVYDKKLNLNLYYHDEKNYGTWEYNLDDNLSLITHYTYYTFMGLEDDRLFIKSSIRDLLKFVLPIPEDYILRAVTPSATKYHYNNEQGILKFIPTIEQMLKNNLVQFNKTGNKPLSKSLNIIFSSSGIREFYSTKKLNLLATDMLTRAFTAYIVCENKFKTNPLDTLKEFLGEQLNNRLSYFVINIFTMYLKKVKFSEYNNSSNRLFDIVKFIINQIPIDSWVSVNNVVKICKYRELEFHIESSSKTRLYYIDGDDDEFFAKDYYNEIFFEPILKASLFYLGALGILELKYDEPISLYENISSKGTKYISPWDGLKYIKFTNLGLYIFGVKDSYTVKEKEEEKTFEIKFDEYKPIITVDKSDSITIAKIEAYCVQLDTTRYILDYGKIFKDCDNIEALRLKIDSFYDNIESNPPQVFRNFFSSILSNANNLQEQTDEVVIKLKNNKKLLALFLHNKKLQDIIIKASGYRVIVLRKDLNKFTKIIKENGFFVNF